MSPDAVLAACRFLHDASAMLLWGASAFLAALVPKDLAREVGRRLLSPLVVSGAVAAATTAAALPLEAAIIGSGWSDAFAPTTLHAVLFETSVGAAWQIQGVAALILLAMLLVPRHYTFTAFASGFLLASLALTGHAVMQQGELGIAHRINDAIHVLSAGAWLGALLPLFVILSLFNTAEFRREASIALLHFSAAGQVIVAVVIGSGIFNTLLILQHWPTDWTSPYQAMLAAKIALVALMVALALVNRFALVPQVLDHSQRAARSIRVGTILEIALALCVVGLVSVFGMLEPA